MAKAVVIRTKDKPKGGGALTRAADDVRKAGRHGDDMLVHVNADEFAQLQQAYGEPTINPETGLPEFFLGSLVSALIPAAVTTLTGAGSAVGGAIGSAVPALSPAVSGFLGNALVGAGTGAAVNAIRGRNVGQGALMGAAGGGLAPMAANALGMQGVGTNAPLGNLLGFGGGATQAAAQGGANVPTPPPRPPGIGQAMTGAATGAAGQAAAGSGGSLMQYALPAMMLAGALRRPSQQAGGDEPPPEYTAEQRRIAADNARPLERVSNVRFRTPQVAQQVNTRYGIDGGEREHFEDNRLPATSRAASGGYVTPRGVLSRMAEGGPVEDGRSDRVRALLSPGEYIFDAESVSMLGNGSSEAGAAMLDRFRERLRKHKGQRMMDGEMSHDAREPAHYMGGRA